MKLKFTEFCLLGSIGLSANAFADPIGAVTDERGTISIVYENDWVDAGRDRNYTNGIRLSYMSGTAPTDGLSKLISKHLMGEDADTVRRYGFALGHSLFTPNNISTSEPLPDEHPYAAWLYGEYSYLISRRDLVDQVSIQIGMVGPSAGGEWIQNEIHQLIGGDPVLGWSNQIKDEPGFVLSYDRRYRALWESDFFGLGVDVTPSVGMSLGNVQTNLRAGAMARFGVGLRSDYGPPRIRPSLAGAGYFTPQSDFSWYLFGGVEGRAVAHDIFIDGSLFRDGPGLDSSDFVTDLQAGIAFQYAETQFAFTYVERSPEFDNQNGAHRFGAFSISRKF